MLLLTSRMTMTQATSSSPLSFKDILGSRTGKLALAGVGAVGLFVGKKAYDGPVFEETVDLSGQNIVITGANTGLGLESAVKLAALNANVNILCRNKEKAEKAVKEIIERSGNSKVEAFECDLADLNSVDKCVATMKADGQLSKGGIDVLMLNAGVMAIPEREVTAQNFEKHMGINHLAHFALTAKLFPMVKASKSGGRVVVVSSSAHLLGKLDRRDLLLSKEGAYQPWPAYGNSKLANILFVRALAARLEAKSSVVTTVCHPGACRTELGRYIFDPESIPKFLYPVLGVVGSPLLYLTKSSYMGSQTQTFLSASRSLSTRDNGKFYDNSKESDTSAEAKDLGEAAWLWEESERLTGVKFNV